MSGRPWLAWLTGGGGLGVVTAAGEIYRRYLETREAAFAKAVEAGALQGALDSCLATNAILAEALKTCGG